MRKSIRVDFSRQFIKQLRKSPLEIKMALRRRLSLFSKEPLNPLLHNHPLEGIFFGYRSINITGDWRAIYSESESETNDQVIVFELLGTHNQLYK